MLNFAAACDGDTVSEKSFWWQPMQVIALPRKTLSPWQPSQLTPVCAPCQREAGHGMIELRPLPGGRRVTVGAQRGESLRVRRVGRALEVAGVAARTGHALAGVHLVGVTGGAGASGMTERQREARRRVIEVRRRPGGERMARRAVLREASGDVVRGLHGAEGLRVAADARRGAVDELQLAVACRRVATFAGDGGVRPLAAESAPSGAGASSPHGR